MPHSTENTFKSLAAILAILALVTLVAGGVFFMTFSHMAADQETSGTSAAVTPAESEEPNDLAPSP